MLGTMMATKDLPLPQLILVIAVLYVNRCLDTKRLVKLVDTNFESHMKLTATND